jgi:diaminopimelate epimerase
MALKFEKWQALGNDYLIVEQRDLPFELTGARVRALCAAHFGVHSDGVLLLSDPGDQRYVARLQIFNPDGSEAELSGNGAREAILYLRRNGWTNSERFTIVTAAGEITPTITSERSCRVEMGRALLASPDFPSGDESGRGSLQSAGRELGFQHVQIGNPQCAIDLGDEVATLDLAALGPPIEASELFPNRTNVSFYRVDDEHHMRARIFERGVGETLSSGTGACGAAIAAIVAGKATSPVTVTLDGGVLDVEVSAEFEIALTGWAERVFKGQLSDEFVQTLEDTTD